MASPKIEAFALFNLTTGAPLTGQVASMSFLTYKDTSGADVVAPTVVEVGGGWYYFEPELPANPDLGLVYVLDTGTGANPTKISRYIRPEDYTTDAIPAVQAVAERVRDFAEGKKEIATTGPDANRFIVYAADGTTPLKKYDLTDENGDPTSTDPYVQTPVSE